MSAIMFHRECLVADIQYQFSLLFPFLKIEFQKTAGSGNDKSKKKLSYYGMQHIDGINYDIQSSTTIKKLIDDLQKYCQLRAAVYRKSGNLWIEVTETRDWTLSRQNEEGKLFEG